MEQLDDAEFGRLCRALIRYGETGEPITPTGNERFYAARVMAQEDRFRASYEQTSATRSAAGKAGASKRWQAIANDGKTSQAMATDSKNANTKPNTKPISPVTNVTGDRYKRPTLDEVAAYCLERGNGVDPERWFAYYESNGWRVGKNPMKDWKAAVRTWERNGIDKPKQGGKSFADMWRDMARRNATR
jgi:hypothetical protein